MITYYLATTPTSSDSPLAGRGASEVPPGFFPTFRAPLALHAPQPFRDPSRPREPLQHPFSGEPSSLSGARAARASSPSPTRVARASHSNPPSPASPPLSGARVRPRELALRGPRRPGPRAGGACSPAQAFGGREHIFFPPHTNSCPGRHFGGTERRLAGCPTWAAPWTSEGRRSGIRGQRADETAAPPWTTGSGGPRTPTEQVPPGMGP